MKFWLILLFLPFCGYSTHLIGGELTYRYLSNDTFEIKMTIYRDCYNGIPPFDDPVSIGIFDSNNSILRTLAISLTSQANITNSIYNCLPVAPSTICYQKGEYIFNVYLPSIPGGYQLAYQRCCFPTGIVNVLNGSTTGFTVYASIPDNIWSTNSSPEFTLQPFSFLCVNTPFSFNNSATDMDGDSLVYSICTPYNGADNFNPIPNPPSLPPYLEIDWLPPYDLNDLIGGTSPFAIDPQTGILSATPNAEGVYTYGISVKEYRAGVYLGETRRNSTLYVITNVGINEIEKSAITISPNPFSASTNIHIDESIILIDAHLEICDELGRIVRTVDEIMAYDFDFNADSFARGVYFYRLLISGSIVGHGKLIVN